LYCQDVTLVLAVSMENTLPSGFVFSVYIWVFLTLLNLLGSVCLTW